MNDIKQQFNQLLADISCYFNYHREVYGNEFYSTFKFNEFITTPAKIKQQLSALYNQIRYCQKCALSQKRNHLVFGSGNPNADIMLIGEAPGQEEDLQGLPFVGAAGQLLTKILAAIGLTREEVYITNIVKCRPPQNRDPLPDEQAICKPYLFDQIDIINPKFILALGRIAAQSLLNTTRTITELRGTVYNFDNIQLIVTYHPAALLRNQQLKKETWEDVKLLQKLYQHKTN